MNEFDKKYSIRAYYDMSFIGIGQIDWEHRYEVIYEFQNKFSLRL